MDNKKLKVLLRIILIILIIAMIIITDQQMATAEVNCSLAHNEAWNNKFPMGLIMGSLPESGLLEDCPIFEIFGHSYPVCSIKQLLEVVKNAVLIKFILNSIQNL